MIARCPKCEEQVCIPEGVVAEATVRCPICSAEYPLADALAAAPPLLIVVDLGVPAGAAPPAAEAQDETLALSVAGDEAFDATIEAWPTIERPGGDVAEGDVDAWIADERPEDAEGLAADALADASQEQTSVAEGEEDVFSFAEDEAPSGVAGEAEESDEFKIRDDESTAVAEQAGKAEPEFDAAMAFAGISAAAGEVTADGKKPTAAQKMRRKRGKEKNPVKEMIGIVLGGFVGLFIAYYGLNFFGGARFEIIPVWLPGVPHTEKHRPAWLGGGQPSAKETVQNGASDAKPKPEKGPEPAKTPADDGRLTTSDAMTGTTTDEPSSGTFEPPITTPPGFEPPTVDAPMIDAPTVDAPMIDAPTIDVPKIDVPAVEPPSTEPPSTEPPSTEPPSPLDVPMTTEPGVETPSPDQPMIAEPSVETPRTDPPSFDMPLPPGFDPFAPAAPAETPKPDAPSETPEPPKADPPTMETPAIEPPAVAEPKIDEPKPDEPMVAEPKVEEPAGVGPKTPPVYTVDDLAAALKDAHAAFGCAECQSRGMVLRDGVERDCEACNGNPKYAMDAGVYAKFARLAEVDIYVKGDAAKTAELKAGVARLLDQVARAGLAAEAGKLAAQHLKSAEGPKGGVLLACTMGKEFSKDGLFGATVETLGDPQRFGVFSNQSFAIEPGQEVFLLGAVLPDPATNLGGATLAKPWIIWTGATIKMPTP